ncbi:MAG: type II secretion system protein GspF [Gammaproteobacteria bacterium]|nr:MAG: type II secretion system protein GspF [Gammaproteobacteria bacterium]
MAAFRYQALNSAGKIEKGVMQGDSERQIRAQLRASQLRPVSVEAVSESAARQGAKSSGGFRLFQPRISVAELALLTRQLATLVQSQLPLDQCLQAAAEQTRRPRTKELLLQVRSRVSEGHTLAYAMGEFPQVFNEMYRAMVNAGEHAGFLGPVLEQLADYSEQRQYAQQKLQMAMVYPIILLCVAVAVVVALMVLVVPELVSIFAHSKRELPALTTGLIATSDFIRQRGIWVLLGLVIAGFIWRWWLSDGARRLRWHALLLRIPGISRLVIASDTARFASTLSILMASGVPLLDSLRIAGAVLGNLVLRKDSQVVAERVQEGSSLNRALADSGRFPPMMVHMVASGEASGELEKMLERSATNQERELETTLGTVMSVFEPLMVVVMGLIVLVIVMAVLLPVFNLNKMVS